MIQLTEIDQLRLDNVKFRQAIHKIDLTLRVPAAEYVPAIGDVFTIIDQLYKEVKPIVQK